MVVTWRVRFWLLALAGLGGLAGPAAAETAARPRPAVFCYVETLFGGVKPEALDLGPCTVTIEAFLLPDSTGAVRAANGLPRKRILRAARQQGSRVLVAVGGATVPGAVFGALARDPALRARFAAEVARFAVEGGYDGVDLDWEFPAPSERALQVELVAALREALRAAFSGAGRRTSPLLVLGVTPGAHLESYDFPSLARHADYFVQFGYDFRNPALGPWAHTAQLWPDGARSPIEASVRSVASQIVSRGAPREKLVVGLPFYASDGKPWVEVRDQALAAARPVDPLFLESKLGESWVTGPEALEAKVRRVLFGKEIAGGPAAGIAIWQLGHQGPYRDLTDALRRALAPGMREKRPASPSPAADR